jgi:glycosyltransferase involved in cell wall biosynthesis
MKVLYIGNWNDGTGWGNAGLNNILAMDAVGINVVPRSITFNGSHETTHPRIYELEGQKTAGSTVCIQHVLPPLYTYRGGMKNVGYCALETLDLRSSGWNHYMKIMDQIWVPNKASEQSCKNAGIKNVKIIPHAIDLMEIANYKKTIQMKELRDTFNFMFVGEFTERKNISALLKAYYLAFNQDLDNVNLFLKINGPTSNQALNIKIYEELDAGVKAQLGLKNYCNVSVMFDYVERNDLLSLMDQCHVFVCTSHGEACCIPAMEAMALGKPCIWTAGIGIDDYGIGKSIGSRLESCSNIGSPLPGIYKGTDRWLSIDVAELAAEMQNMARSYDCYDKALIKNRMAEYDIYEIGMEIMEALNA